MHDKPGKNVLFFNPAAPVLQTRHAVLRRNSPSPGANVSGADRHLSNYRLSALRGNGYWYDTIHLSSFDSTVFIVFIFAGCFRLYHLTLQLAEIGGLTPEHERINK